MNKEHNDFNRNRKYILNKYIFDRNENFEILTAFFWRRSIEFNAYKRLK